MSLLHTFMQVLQSLQIFTNSGACFWSCLPVPSTMLYFYLAFTLFSVSGMNLKVTGLLIGMHAAELLYLVLIPMAIRKLAPQITVYTCLTHLRAPPKIVWVSASLLFGAVLCTGLMLKSGALSVWIPLTALNFFNMLYVTLFGAFVGIICKSFGVKCR